jgi:hypothetical protein
LNNIFCENQITHVVGSISNCIDVAVSNDASFISNMQVHSDSLLLSDHFPISVTLTNTIINDVDISFWNVNKADWKSFEKCVSYLLQGFDIESLHSFYHFTPQYFINLIVKKLTNTLLHAGDLYVGKMHIKCNNHTIYKKPVIQQFHRYMKDCKRLHRIHHNNDFYKLLYYNSVTLFKHAVYYEKVHYLNHTIQRLADANKNIVWKAWRTITNSIGNNNLPLLNNHVSVIDGLNFLAEYFSNVSSHPITDYNTFSVSNKKSHLDTRELVSDFINTSLNQFTCYNDTVPFSLQDVVDECTGCILSGIGQDDIPSSFIVHAGILFYNLLFSLFKYCYKYSIWPTTWKVGKVKPIYKKSGDKYNVSNYRPVCITNTLSRLFELVVFNCMKDKFSFIISPYQAGFRRKYSTVDQVYILTEHILHAFQLDTYVPVLFLDLHKAFDSVWIDGLLYKLHLCKFDLSFIKLIQSFLSSRSIYLYYNNVKSNLFNVCYGVPQGSVLSPSLFSIFINDVFSTGVIPRNILGLAYADDLCATPREGGKSSLDKLQIVLYNIHNWCCKWLCKINPSKSNVVIFGLNSIITSDNMRLKLDSNTFINFSNVYRYLGIYLQYNLKYDIMESYIINKIIKLNYLLSRLYIRGVYISPLVIRNLIKSILFGVINYGLAVWRPSISFFNRINSLLMSTFRKVFHVPHTTSIHALFMEFRLFPIEYLREWMLYLHCRRLLLQDDSFVAKQFLLHSYKYQPQNYMDIRSSSSYIKKKQSVLAQFQKQIKCCQPLVFDLQYVSLQQLFNGQLSRALVNNLIFNTFINNMNQSKVLDFVDRNIISTDLPLYLRVLHPSRVQHFFEIRFDICRFNCNIISRHIASSNHQCPYCISRETRSHVLLHCIRYSLQRQHLLHSLSSLIHIQNLSINLLLGEFHDKNISEYDMARYIVLISNFIEFIYSVRFKNL